MFKILGSGPEHCGAPNIDLFNGFFETAIGPFDGRLKRVKINSDKIDKVQAMLLNLSHMIRVISLRQKPPMNPRMERLDSSIQHRRKLCKFSYILYRNTIISQHLGRSTRRKNLYA